jgi:hypothetical protein
MSLLLTQINWLAVIIAGLAALVIGFIWYLPPLFGRPWAHLVKAYGRPYGDDPTLDPMQPANPFTPMGVWLIGFLINAYILAQAINLLAISNVVGAILLGLAAWAGFAAPLSSWPAAFARWPWGLWLINNGCYLVIQMAMAVILTLWQ